MALLLTLICRVFKNHGGFYKDIKQVGQGIQKPNTSSFFLLHCLQSKIEKIPDTVYESKPDEPSDIQTVTSTVLPHFLSQFLALYLLFHMGFFLSSIPFSVCLLHMRT